MTHWVYDTPAEAIRDAWAEVSESEHYVAPRGLLTRELLNYSMTIRHIEEACVQIPERKLAAGIMALEACSLVGQTSHPEAARRWPALYGTTNGGIFDGAYGLRIHGMLPRIVQLLQRDPYSRQAVLTIFNSREDITKDTSDNPCTLSLQFFVRRGVLETRVSMRSNDVWLGLPYDLVQFAAVASAVAAALHIPLGAYHHTVGSFHIYEQQAEQAHTLAANDEIWENCTYIPIGWGGDGLISRISSRARECLTPGAKIEEPTVWEEWCQGQFQ